PRAVGVDARLGRRRETVAGVGRRRPAPADQQLAVAHRARLGLALLPAELLRAHAVALLEVVARPRLVAGRVDRRVVDDAQLKGVDLQRVGQLVQRRLQGEGAGAFAGGAHRRRRGDVDVEQLVRRLYVRA